MELASIGGPLVYKPLRFEGCFPRNVVVYKQGEDGDSPKFKKNNNTEPSSKRFRDESRFLFRVFFLYLFRIFICNFNFFHWGTN
jgi:hypothetical protein